MSFDQLAHYYDNFAGNKSDADLSELDAEKQGWWNNWVKFDTGGTKIQRDMYEKHLSDLTPNQQLRAKNTFHPAGDALMYMRGDNTTGSSKHQPTHPTLNRMDAMTPKKRTWIGFLSGEDDVVGKGKRKSRRSRVHSRSKKSTRRRRKA